MQGHGEVGERGVQAVEMRMLFIGIPFSVHRFGIFQFLYFSFRFALSD